MDIIAHAFFQKSRIESIKVIDFCFQIKWWPLPNKIAAVQGVMGLGTY